MDHIRFNLDDLFSRYNPTVERHRYSIEFIPVVEDDATDDEILKAVNFNPWFVSYTIYRKTKAYLRISLKINNYST